MAKTLIGTLVRVPGDRPTEGVAVVVDQMVIWRGVGDDVEVDEKGFVVFVGFGDGGARDGGQDFDAAAGVECKEIVIGSGGVLIEPIVAAADSDVT